VATAKVTIDALNEGVLPEVCIKTGAPCSNFVKTPLRAYGSSRGVLAWISRVWSMGKPLAARVPAVPQRIRLHTGLVGASWIVVVALIAVLVLTFVADFPIALALVVFLLYILLVAAGSYVWIGAEMGDDPQTFVLTRVHSEFANAVASQAPPAREA
jgi:hypothetical protein